MTRCCSSRRRRRRRCSDENINLHIIKAAAIKAIEIMQIIRKRRCRGNFCRHLKSFRRLSPMNIEQPRTCRPPPFPITRARPPCTPSTSQPSLFPLTYSFSLSFSHRNDFEHELVHHRRPRAKSCSQRIGRSRGGLRAMNRIG